MSAAPYFYSESLRQRFQRNIQVARTAARITAEEARYLEQLSDSDQPMVGQEQSLRLYRLVLEDGSPQSLGMVTALVIERWTAAAPVIYLDTLFAGLMRFTDRQQLQAYAGQAFSVSPALHPAFELELLEGSLFEQRMWQVIGHQAQTSRWLANDLQELPSLDQVLDRLLASRLGGLWSGGDLDLHAPLVQVVQQIAGGSADQQSVVGVRNLEQLTLDALTGKRLPAGQRCRLIGRRGHSLDFIDLSRYRLHLTELTDTYEERVEHYWKNPDAQGLTRRERFAQALADAFSHQVWMLHPSAPFSTDTLARITAAALHRLAPVAVSRLFLTVGTQGPRNLVSLYLIYLERGTYALYSPLKGVRLLENRQALDRLVASPAGRRELRHYLTLEDQHALPDLETMDLQVHDHPLDQPLFYHCIDAIIGLQAGNVHQALQRTVQDEGELRAMLDDALDIRALVDGSLPYVGAAGRWLREPKNFLDAWPSAPLLQPLAQPLPSGALTPALSWGEQLRGIESTLREISTRRPPLEALARQALSPYLAALGCLRPHDGQDIRLTWNEEGACDDGDARTYCETSHAHGLTDLVLEHISGARHGSIPPESRVQRVTAPDQAEGLGAVSARLLETVVARVATALQASCIADFQAFYDRPLRSTKAQIQVGRTLRATREQLLRLELAMARRKNVVAPSLLDRLQNLVDRPLSDTRRESVEAVAIRIELSGKTFVLGLDVAWALQLPGQAQQSLLFWSPLIGLVEMQSLAALQAWLQTLLAETDLRATWLAVFPGEDRQWADKVLASGAMLSLTLERVEGDFLQRMQQEAQRGQGAECATALLEARQQAQPAGLFNNAMALAGNDGWLLAWLDCLSVRAQSLLFISAMPEWLTKATLQDLDRYIERVKIYFRNNDPDEDFLAGVPTMQHFARQRVLEALKRDFPDHALDPDTITVVKTSYVLALVHPGEVPLSVPGATLVNSESLMDFSLNHFSHAQNGVLSVHMAGATPAPARLDAHYVYNLIHDLNVGQQYRTLLAEHLSPETPDYGSRRDRFMQQVPSRLLVAAMELKMQGTLSQTAFDYIACVLNMPDGTARQPIHGQLVVLRPLALIPRKGMAANRVDGFFLIGPREPAQGPVILHVQLSEAFIFKEFRDDEHVLAELRTNVELQNLLLGRLDPHLQTRYGNGGLNEAHIALPLQGPDPLFDTTLGRLEKVSLGTDVIEGNALRHLFEALVQLMKQLARTQAVTNGEATWAQFVFLMRQLFDTVAFLVPGKLGILIALSQGTELLGESVDAAVERQWAIALTDFTVAMTALATIRHQEIEAMRGRLRPEPGESVNSWRGSALFAERRVRQRLPRFEARDVDLASLQHDALRNLYQEPATHRLYAAVEGRIYQVQQFKGDWRIKGATRLGPKVELDRQQRWQLVMELELGGAAPRIRPGVSDRVISNSVNSIIAVRAQGMENIRLYSREDARSIGLARVQALGYLKTTLFNLNAPSAELMAEPVQGVLKSFFGVAHLTPQLIHSVRQRFVELYAGLSDASLDPLSSTRFVLGTARVGEESTAAFMVFGDVRKRIFLSDEFFTPPIYHLKDVLPGNRAFNSDEHYRAATLIHELSHLTSETLDFAYLDAVAPHPEMLDTSLPRRLALKQRLEIKREKGLSHLTPRDQLFRIKGRQGWRDLQPGDGPLLDKLLGLTGQPTLDGARDAFLKDPQVRSKVILGNADSLAALATLLGRERFQ